MAISVADPGTLTDAARRAAAMLRHHAEQLDRAARVAAEELAEGETRQARASMAVAVATLNELAAILPSSTRLARGALRALDDDLTAHGGHHAADHPERRRFERRLGDRRAGLGGRRTSDDTPAPTQAP